MLLNTNKKFIFLTIFFTFFIQLISLDALNNLTRMGRQNRFFGTRIPPLSGTDIWGRKIDIRSFPRVPLFLIFLKKYQIGDAEKWLHRLPRDLLFKEKYIFLVILNGRELRGLAPKGNVLRIVRKKILRILRKYEKTLDKKEKRAFKKMHKVFLIDWKERLKNFFGIRRDPLPIIILDEALKIIAYYNNFNLEVYQDLINALKRYEKSLRK
ncbi:hypothetical protein ACFL35_15750 [Candidatus Riflebacteria bacterium]